MEILHGTQKVSIVAKTKTDDALTLPFKSSGNIYTI